MRPPGFWQIAPTGTPLGSSSNLNVTARSSTVPNAVVVPVGNDGTVTIYTETGGYVLVDVMGYFTSGTAPDNGEGLFVPLRPERLADTRGGARIGGSNLLNVSIRGRAGVPANASAAMLNVTATQTASGGYVQVFRGANREHRGRART